MLRLNNCSRTFQKRTLRPLMGNWRSYPESVHLDVKDMNQLGNPIIAPGMLATCTGDGLVSLATKGTIPFGLFNNWVGGDMDELGGTTECGVWSLDDPATFEFLNYPVTNSWSNNHPLSLKDNWLESKWNLVYAGEGGRISLEEYGDPLGAVSFEAPITTPFGVKVVIDFSMKIDPYLAGWNEDPQFVFHPRWEDFKEIYEMGQCDRRGIAEDITLEMFLNSVT